jgi:hypothetical protein
MASTWNCCGLKSTADNLKIFKPFLNDDGPHPTSDSIPSFAIASLMMNTDNLVTYWQG